MQYVLLIYQSEAEWEKLNEKEKAAISPEYAQSYRSIRQSGHFRAGAELKPTSSATTVRVRNDKRLVTDGPFAETKEQLVGFFLIEAKDLDEALSIGARIPAARFGAVEVRPAVTHGPN